MQMARCNKVRAMMVPRSCATADMDRAYDAGSLSTNKLIAGLYMPFKIVQPLEDSKIRLASCCEGSSAINDIRTGSLSVVAAPSTRSPNVLIVGAEFHEGSLDASYPCLVFENRRRRS